MFLPTSSQHKNFQLHKGGMCNYCNRIVNHKQTNIRNKYHVIIKTTQVNTSSLFVTATWKTSLLSINFIHNSFLLAEKKNYIEHLEKHKCMNKQTYKWTHAHTRTHARTHICQCTQDIRTLNLWKNMCRSFLGCSISSTRHITTTNNEIIKIQMKNTEIFRHQ